MSMKYHGCFKMITTSSQIWNICLYSGSVLHRFQCIMKLLCSRPASASITRPATMCKPFCTCFTCIMYIRLVNISAWLLTSSHVCQLQDTAVIWCNFLIRQYSPIDLQHSGLAHTPHEHHSIRSWTCTDVAMQSLSGQEILQDICLGNLKWQHYSNGT